MNDYLTLCREAKALISGVDHLTADLANLSALIFGSLDRINWAGFYLLTGDRLILGPFQGKPACIEIRVGHGVCGSAVKSNAPLLVHDVHRFPGHIACDPESRSEIVVPVKKDGVPVAVLDIDSPEVGRFDDHDLEGLEKLVQVIEEELYHLF